MLLNGKAEDLQRYSKLKYVADKFIEKAREVWEYSDLQIRCIYLISDLAKKGSGVFSIAYSTFKKMFEQRFNMKISLSTVRRFFILMEKLDLVSINEAKRKNEQQSANIYIIEQQCNEQPVEHPCEHQNVSKETDVKQKPLSNNVTDVKQDVTQDEIIFDTYIEFKQQGIDKPLFDKVLNEVQSKRGILNFGAYLRGALNKVVNHIDSRKKTKDLMAFYDEIEEETCCNSNRPQFYNWLEQ